MSPAGVNFTGGCREIIVKCCNYICYSTSRAPFAPCGRPESVADWNGKRLEARRENTGARTKVGTFDVGARWRSRETGRIGASGADISRATFVGACCGRRGQKWRSCGERREEGAERGTNRAVVLSWLVALCSRFSRRASGARGRGQVHTVGAASLGARVRRLGLCVPVYISPRYSLARCAAKNKRRVIAIFRGCGERGVRSERRGET